MTDYTAPSATIHVGDALAVLPALPAASVHCCVTSPPYWGLRDYGTAQWEGGDADCDHKLRNARNDPDRDTRHTDGRNPATQNDVGCQDIIQHRGICPKCGAHRIDSQLGLEPTPEEYVTKLVAVFREVRRVLRDDGTLWLNLGDSYAASGGDDRKGSSDGATGRGDRPDERRRAGLKPKDLVGIPWRVAFALQADGWYLRSDIIWSKPNPMPESVTDRPTKAHEYVFLMSKGPRYWYDAEAVREENAPPVGCGGRQSAVRNGDPSRYDGADAGHKRERGNDGWHQGLAIARGDLWTCGRNRRTVWTIKTQPYPEAHFATYPEKLVEPCVLAGCPVGGTVLDPFTGSGTTGAVACRLGRDFIGIELNPEYAAMAERRIAPYRDQTQLRVEA